ncbi:MAG: SCO family protein [Verrucomicrobiae bacterium]|nr:SCO family protein [Verrucomicrobiae bacterium]
MAWHKDIPSLGPLMAVVAFCLSACGERSAGSANSKATIDRYREVSDFTFTNQEGEAVSREELIGKVWVANFVFTSCGAECLILSQKMAALQNRFANREDVAFVSFSVDPQTDKPERLADYGKRWGADNARWQFFTGDPAALDAIIKESFLLPVARTPMEKANLMTAGFIHSNKLAIVDRQGVVRAYVEGLEANAIDETARVINTLLAEPGPPSAPTP